MELKVAWKRSGPAANVAVAAQGRESDSERGAPGPPAGQVGHFEAEPPIIALVERGAPAPGAAFGFGLLAARALMQVQGGSELLGQGTRLVLVEALAGAEVLRAPARRLGARDRDRLDAPAHRLSVIAVRTVDHRPEGDAAAVGQQGALASALAPVGGVEAGFPPPGGALPIAPASANHVQPIPAGVSEAGTPRP